MAKITNTDYPGLADLPEDELEQLLFQDFLLSTEEPDEALLSAVLEELQERQGRPVPSPEATAALAAFHASYDLSDLPETETEPPAPPEKPRPRRRTWFGGLRAPRWCRFAAAICALTVVLVGIVHAKEPSFQIPFFHSGTFSYPRHPETGTEAILHNQDYMTAVSAIGEKTTEQLLPTWYPEDAVVADIEGPDIEELFTYTIAFTHKAGEFCFDVVIYDSVEEMESAVSLYEKNEDSGEIFYDQEGNVYYLFMNTDHHVATWRQGTAECSISGYLTTDELKEMLESIHLEGN